MSWSHNLSAPAAIRYGHALAVATAAVAAGGALLMVGVMLDARAPADVAAPASNSTARAISPVAKSAATPDQQKIATQAVEPAAPAATNSPVPTNQQKVATQASEPAAPAAASPSVQKPVFDVLRVEPNGEAVVAGHASPNGDLQLRADGLVVAETNADRFGDFTMSPPPFTAGPHPLELSVKAGGGPAVLSDPVTIDVAAHETKATSTPPLSHDVAAPSAPATASSTLASASEIGSSKPNANPASPTEGVTIVARTPTPPPRPNFDSLPTKYSEAGAPKRDKALLASLSALPYGEGRGGGHATSR
jgi:hypothetical protein